MKNYILSFLTILFLGNSSFAQLNYLITVDGGDVFGHSGELFTACAPEIDYPIRGVVINKGSVPITSFDIIVDSTMIYSYTENLGEGEAFRYEIPDKINTGTSLNVHTVEIANVNSDPNPDTNIDDNLSKIVFDPVTVAEDKAILIEEVTGTWCGACPRGTVYLDEMTKRFGKHVVGVAVHNDDPMAREDHIDALFGNLPIFFYPSMAIDRKEAVDGDDVVAPSIEALQTPPIATIELGGTLDAIYIKTSARITFKEDVTDGNFSVAVIITEDNIINDSNSGYDQVNIYSGQAVTDDFPMGGFGHFDPEVKSSWWPYDHVSRLLIGGFDGVNALKGNFSAGDQSVVEFNLYPTKSSWNADNLKAAVILIDTETNEILNATSVKYSEVLDNGVFTNTDELLIGSNLNVYPNPAGENINVKIDLTESAPLVIDLIDNQGKLVDRQKLSGTIGNNNFSMEVTDQVSGIYWVKIQVNDRFVTRKISIQK